MTSDPGPVLVRGVDECEEGTRSTGSCLCFWNGGQAPAGDPLLVEFAPGVGKGREATGCDQGISVVNTDFTGRIRDCLLYTSDAADE